MGKYLKTEYGWIEKENIKKYYTAHNYLFKKHELNRFIYIYILIYKKNMKLQLCDTIYL